MRSYTVSAGAPTAPRVTVVRPAISTSMSSSILPARAVTFDPTVRGVAKTEGEEALLAKAKQQEKKKEKENAPGKEDVPETSCLQVAPPLHGPRGPSFLVSCHSIGTAYVFAS